MYGSTLAIMNNPKLNAQMQKMSMLMASHPGELARLTQGLSHEAEKHAVTDDPEELIVRQLDRALKERKPVSSFNRRYSIDKMTETAIQDNMANLIMWNNGNYKMGTKDGCFRMESRNMFQTVGTGIRWVADREGNEHLQHVETKQAAIILTKNMGSINEFGFTRKTSYPNIMTEEAQPTGINLAKYIERTDAYKTATPDEQAWMKKVTELPKQNITCKPIKQTELKARDGQDAEQKHDERQDGGDKNRQDGRNHKNHRNAYRNRPYKTPRNNRQIPDSVKKQYLSLDGGSSIGEPDRMLEM